jgi:hypothetical protein
MNTLYKSENVYSVGVHVSWCTYRIQRGSYTYREFMNTLYKGENVYSDGVHIFCCIYRIQRGSCKNQELTTYLYKRGALCYTADRIMGCCRSPRVVRQKSMGTRLWSAGEDQQNVTWPCQAGWQRNRKDSHLGQRIVYLLPSAQTCSGAHPAGVKRTEREADLSPASSPEVKNALSWNFTTWCLIKHKDNLI